jgi:NADPH:quinone reductase-like Zn-dependent oxidoreductase
MPGTNTMSAAVLDAYGRPLNVTRVPIPDLRPGHVLVRIEASGVNPLDTKIRAGLAAHARTEPPAILGIDLSGTVEAAADDVSAFASGDHVYGMTGGVGGVPGSLADYAVVDARLLAHRPATWTARQAAAVPLAAISAWEGLVDRAGLQANQRVLIHGGAGGVGHLAVQLARARGAEVFATGSKDGLAAIEAYGATAIDYTAVTPSQYVDEFTDGRGFDIVFDTIGGATLDASFASVRRYTGHVVSILGWGTHSLAPLSFRGATYSGVFTLLPLITGEGREHHGEILEQVAILADAGKITPRLDPRTFTLQSVHEAHQAVEAGDTQGKIVVDIS